MEGKARHMELDIQSIREDFCELRKQFPDIDILEDGILDFSQYKESSPRIVWLLKQEIYADGCLERDYATRIRDCIENKCNVPQPWRNMSYVSHMLLNNVTWDEVSNKREEDYSNLKSLLKTAVIEVNKEPSETTSSRDKVILDGFQRYKDLIFRQIDLYLPEIVIFGGGNGLFSIFNELSKRYANHDYNPQNAHHFGKCDTVCFRDINNRCTFVWAYHPSNPMMNASEYCKSIVAAYHASIK